MSDAKRRKVLDNAKQDENDVVIQCYDGDVECHRNVLVNGSPYFKMMFDNENVEKENEKTIVELDLDKNTCMVLLQYLNTGQVDDSQISLQLLLEADRLNMINLKRKCSEHILSIIIDDNCFDIANMAEKAGAITLMDAADQYLIDNTPDMSEKLKDELVLNPRVLKRIFFKSRNIY